MIALLAAATLACTPVPGAAALWQDPNTQFVFVGETHGTSEAPALFADLVCQTAQTRPVVVAVEQNEEMQGAIDAFTASDGGADARAALLTAAVWHQQMQDGRGSQAYLALFERLRQMRRAGMIQDVRGIQPAIRLQPGDNINMININALNNEGMAKLLKQLAADHPGALVLVYTGSMHAAKTAKGPPDHRFLPAAALLPAEHTRNVLLDGDSGTGWMCTPECGPHPVGMPGHHERGAVLEPFALMGGGPNDYDGRVYVGTVFTASPPAVASKP
jgi:hypothetical protein